MKSIFFALFFVVFTSAQVITFSNYFAPTYEGTTTTNLIRVTNNGAFFQNGKNTIQSIKFRISVDSVKPRSASAVFNPVDNKFFGAIVGGADGFFYFNVNGLNGTYQCDLHMVFVDSNGNSVKIAPYKFAFTILKKQSRDVVGRIRTNEETQLVYQEGKMIDSTAEYPVEVRDLQARATVNPDCPTPSTIDAYWTNCDMQSVLPQTTANSITMKNQIPTGTGTYPVMANIQYNFTSVSISTNVYITQAATTLFANQVNNIFLNITSFGSCNTYFTFNVRYQKAKGTTPSNLVLQSNTYYTWSTTFNPIFTYAAQGASC